MKMHYLFDALSSSYLAAIASYNYCMITLDQFCCGYDIDDDRILGLLDDWNNSLQCMVQGFQEWTCCHNFIPKILALIMPTAYFMLNYLNMSWNETADYCYSKFNDSTVFQSHIINVIGPLKQSIHFDCNTIAYIPADSRHPLFSSCYFHSIAANLLES